MDVSFGVLGPLEVRSGAAEVRVDGPRLRALLALLLASAGTAVSLPALIEGLWGAEPPADAGRTVRAYVSLLRTALRPAGEGLIVTGPAGYQLSVPADAVDAARFEELALAGRRALRDGRAGAAAEDLAAALGLWRGPAYPEFGDCAPLRAEADRLAALRLTAVQDRIEADLATGLGADLVAELEQLTGTHPGLERPWGQLMTALYRAGRQTDALAAFRQARTRLEPSAELAELHRQVLEHDPRLLPPGVAAQLSGRARPAQLPLPPPGFTGRRQELAELDTLVPTGGVAVVSGTAGVGKTALAVHWAHAVADRFPAGQLYVDLHGFGGQPVDPAQAIADLLDALGVNAEQVPPGLEARTELYRSVFAGQRLLLVLDNARDADQARPLLPGTPTAVVVLTSRNQLAPLVAGGAAHPVALDLLSAAEARELLAARLGRDRITAEPGAADELIAGCARLPLALGVAAARSALHPRYPLRALAAELNAAQHGLDALSAGDQPVRAVFSWSYQALTPAAARLFRLSGLHPGPAMSGAAAASLAGVPLDVARELLTEVRDAGLLAEPEPGRYASHDLLRAYAADLAAQHDSEPDRGAAVGRLLGHYLHTAHAAAMLAYPTRDPLPLPVAPPAAGTTSQPLSGEAEASAWLGRERAVLMAAVRLAAATGRDTLASQLAWSLDAYLHRHGHWDDLAGVWETAVAQQYDPHVLRLAHRRLGMAYTLLRRYAEAEEHYTLALDFYERTGDLVGQARVHQHQGFLWDRQGRPDAALHHAQRAFALFSAAGHDGGQADVLNSIGWCHALLGNYEQALTHCSQSLALQQGRGDRYGEAEAWDSLGYAYHHLGDYTHAAGCYQRAMDLLIELDDPYYQATTLTHLGDTRRAAGNVPAARDSWQQALAILTDLNHPDAREVRNKLTTLP